MRETTYRNLDNNEYAFMYFQHTSKKHYTFDFRVSQNRNHTVAFQVGCGLSGGAHILTVMFE